MYVYDRSEPNLWTVGFYDPNGKWHPESDHDNSEDAAERVSYLNGNYKKKSCHHQRQLKNNQPNYTTDVITKSIPKQKKGGGATHEAITSKA